MNLTRQIQSYTNSLEKKRPELSGLLGLAIDGSRQITVASRPGFVYVRLRDSLSEAVQAFNDKVSPVYDFPVLIERRGNRWIVTGKDDLRYSNWGTSSPFLPAHGEQHSFNRDTNTGADTVFVYPDQFMPLLVYPSGTSGAANLMVAPYLLQRTNDFAYVGNTGTRNLLIYKPTNSQGIVGIVALNKSTGNPDILIASGTPFNGSITGTAGILPYLPYPSSDQEPLYAFRLVSGTSALTWDNLYNMRQFVGGSTSTGTSGSGLPTFITGSVPFSGSDGILKEDNLYFRWLEGLRGLRLGKEGGSFFSSSDIFHLGMVSNNVDQSTGVGILVYGTGTSGSPSATYNGYKSRGTLQAPTPVQSGDALVTYVGAGYDGANWQNASRVRFYANGDWVTGTYLPTRYEVEITPSGSATRGVYFTVYGDSVNIPNTGTYNVAGVPHTHSYIDISGWISIPATWTRTGNHTFTVSGDVTAIYRKGTKVRYKDGGAFEYGYVYSSTYSAPNTTVTLFTNSDYAMAATTLTETAISYIENPSAFPDWLNWTPILTGFSVAPTNQVNRFKVIGTTVYCTIRWATAGTSNATTLTWSLPGAAKTITNMYWISLMRAVDNGTLLTGGAMGYIASASSVCECFTSFAGGTWTASGNKYITIGNINYEF